MLLFKINILNFIIFSFKSIFVPTSFSVNEKNIWSKLCVLFCEKREMYFLYDLIFKKSECPVRVG